MGRGGGTHNIIMLQAADHSVGTQLLKPYISKETNNLC